MTVPPFRGTTPLDQFADWIGGRLDMMEVKLMATVAQLQSAFDGLTASFDDFASDVTATLQRNQKTFAQMQATLDAALANDATDAATIADLRAQLANLSAGTDSVLARITALNGAVAAADVAVDQPAPPAP